ncbi:MAG TPA: SRPBCC family protein [Thermoanaerobaculia bacterium]|nr:SRPBCC family protein [Thermoanaerobaculia bacterium]
MITRSPFPSCPSRRSRRSPAGKRRSRAVAPWPETGGRCCLGLLACALALVPAPAGLAATAPGRAAPSAVATPAAGPSDEMRRLAAGEVLIAARTVGPGSLAEQVARGVIDAPPERVYCAVTDFAHYREFMPFVHRSDAATERDGSVVSFQSLDLPFPVGNRYYKIRATSRVEESGGTRAWRTSWSYIPGTGNVTAHRGSWSLVEFGAGRTLAACTLYTDPGGHTPGWAMNRGTEQTLPYIFSGLRQHVHRSRYDHSC